MDPLTIATMIFMGISTADQLLTKPPENNIATTAQPTGGGGSAQQIFTSGQPQPKAQALPQAVQPAMDPNVTAATNSLAMGPPSPQGPPSPIGQSIIDTAIQSGLPLNVPNSPLMPKGPPQDPTKTDIGGILGNINNAAGAMAALAPLLGFGPQPERGISHAGAAGGQPGQSLFQLPQRNTLAQILASLPRTYNG